MKFSIEQELNYEKLKEEIKKYLDLYKYPEQPYLFMNQETLEEFKEKKYLETICGTYEHPSYFQYLCCKIIIDDGFKYGEVELR